MKNLLFIVFISLIIYKSFSFILPINCIKLNYYNVGNFFDSCKPHGICKRTTSFTQSCKCSFPYFSTTGLACDKKCYNGVPKISESIIYSKYCKCNDGYFGESCLYGNLVSSVNLNNEIGFQDGDLSIVKFNRPHSVRFLTKDLVLVADYFNHKIRIIDFTKNNITTIAGSTEGHQDGFGLNAKFSAPSYICVSPDKTWAGIVDERSGKLRKLNFDTLEVTTLRNVYRSAGCLVDEQYIYHTSFDGYVARDQIINGSIIPNTEEKIYGFNVPIGLSKDNNNNIVVAERTYNTYNPSGNGRISKFDPNTLIITSFLLLGSPQDVVYSDGKMFTVNRYSGNKLNMNHIPLIRHVEGNLDGPLHVAQLQNPVSIDVFTSKETFGSHQKTVYLMLIADYGSNSIKRIKMEYPCFYDPTLC